jgi:protein-disulfide isomerase
MDYRCGYCKKAFEEVNQLLAADGNIRFIVKEFPILGEQSDLASRFAVAVLQLEGAETYGKVHDALMAHRGDFTPEVLAGFATEFGFADTAAVMARMNSEEVNAVIVANHALGGRLQINGTPTFIIDNTVLRGYVPLDGMQQVVAAERKG